MEQITGEFALWATQLGLILIRVSALFLLSPIWGRANVPAPLKIGLSLLLSLILIQFFPPPAVSPFASLPAFVLAAMGELLVGLTLGFVTTMFFGIVFTAGHIIDNQIGFGMVQVYDTASNIQVPIAGSLLNLIILICFMLSGGHMTLIRILINTFDRIPIAQVQIKPETALVLLDGFVRSFALAVQVAMPIIASGLLAEISLGVIVRTAPQMNVFVIGIPIKTIIGLVMLFLIMPVFVSVTGPIFQAMFESLDSLFESLVPT